MSKQILKRPYLLLGLFALVLTGCANDLQDLKPEKSIEPASEAKATRSNLPFEEDWENYSTITISDGTQIYTPWNYKTGGNVSKKRAEDIKKEDGWILLLHNFDSTVDTDRSQPYMLFYNQVSGDLKFFTYIRNQPPAHNTAAWQLIFNDYHGIMNSYDRISSPASHQFAKNNNADDVWAFSMEQYQSLHPRIDKEWNVCVIPGLAYDPNCSKNLSLDLDVAASEVTFADIFGESNGDVNGMILSYKGSNPFQKTKNTIATYAGESAKKIVGDKLLNGVFDNSKIISAISGGVGGFIKKGAHVILDKLFRAFDRNDTTISEVRLKTHNEIKMDARMTTEKHSGFTRVRMDIGKNITGCELGTWNLTENPTVYLHPVGVISGAPAGLNSADNPYRFKMTGRIDYNVVINPDLLPHIRNYKVTCIPLMYSATSTEGKDQVPSTSVAETDFGALGNLRSNPGLSWKHMLYQGKGYNIMDEFFFEATYHSIWNRFGKNYGKIPIYKYFYAPGNDDIKYGGKFEIDPNSLLIKVIMEMEVEFEGKVFTCVDTRTYRAKFEWDPDKVHMYGGVSLPSLQDYADHDSYLKDLDNGTYDRLLKSAGY